MKKFFYGLVLWLCNSLFCFAQMLIRQVIPLDSAFAMAERNSTNLKLSGAAVEIKEAAIGVAENSRLPSVDLSLSAKYLGDGIVWDRDFSNAMKAPIPDIGNDFSLQASYVVFAGKAISTAIEKTKLEAQIAALSHEKNRTNIRFLVAGNYLNIYKLYNQKEVFEKNIEQTDEVIRQVKARQSAGMALDNDLTRYELLRKNLELALLEIGNKISIINLQMVITLGLPEETIIIPDSLVQLLGAQPILNNDFLEKATRNRQEIKIKELNKDIAQKDITLAKADLYPSVTLIGGDFLNGPILVEVPPLNKNLNYWFAGVALKYNIGAIYKSEKNIALAQRALLAANLAYDSELEQTQIAVHSAYIQYSETYAKLSSYEKSFELAEQNYRVINNRYQNGLVLITEMLDASNIKLNAELQLVNAKLDGVYQYFNLLREAGIL